MRLLLAQLAPALGDLDANLRRVEEVVRAHPSDLAVFPELFLSGYRVGDRFHEIALRPEGLAWQRLVRLAGETRTSLVVGAPLASPERAGELQNAAVLFRADGTVDVQVKRYLPTFGPFEEGVPFSPSDLSRSVLLGPHRLGFAICYDTFFPEVFRALALEQAELLVVLSASPVTSGALFAKLLPARAIENGLPVLFVNRVGVEDGIVFGGGSGGWDPRGEPLPFEAVEGLGRTPEEAVLEGEVDLSEPARWRPFRPVLRDLASRPGAPTRESHRSVRATGL